MKRVAILLGITTALLVPSAQAASEDWAFRTPGHAAYCDFVDRGFECMTPTDGFWIRLTVDRDGLNARVKKGFSDAYVGYRNSGVQLLRFGRQWASSDASLFSCWSREGGLTCKHIEGLSFWLGRERGYRIFIDPPGFVPHVRPFFRTSHGIWCGLDLDNLEPASPLLDCWRPKDGLTLALSHVGGSGYSRHEKSRGFRPSGFPLLGDDESFAWRCRRVGRMFAEGCSTRSGPAVLTCVNRHARLTCTNSRGRGFWVSARSFYGF